SIAFSLSIFSRIARRCRMASRLFIVVSLLMESAVIGLTDTGLLSEQFPLNILCPSTDCLRRPLVVHSASAGARVTIWTGTLEGKRTSFVLVLPGIATPAATVCMLAVTAWQRDRKRRSSRTVSFAVKTKIVFGGAAVASSLERSASWAAGVIWSASSTSTRWNFALRGIYQQHRVVSSTLSRSHFRLGM